MVLNVTSQDSINEALATIKKNHGMPAILVNNAAITQDNLLLRMKEEEWDAVIQTNLTSIYKVTKACLRDMLKMHWGRIISIGSVVGSIGNAGQVNYSAAKAGLLGFTRALAQEVGSRDITVNAIAPGFIDTDMTRSLSEDNRNALLQHVAIPRLGQPDDMRLLSFLASEFSGLYYWSNIACKWRFVYELSHLWRFRFKKT